MRTSPCRWLSLQLLGVVTIAAVGGLWPGVVCAIASPLLVNWFLVQPYGSFHIGDRQNEATLVVFIAAAGTVAARVSILSARAATAERRSTTVETIVIAPPVETSRAQELAASIAPTVAAVAVTDAAPPPRGSGQPGT